MICVRDIENQASLAYWRGSC